MKKFKFRLEPLLKVKAHREKQRQKEHATAVNNEMTQAQKLDELAHHRNDVVSLQSEMIGKTLSPNQLMTYARYMMKLRKDGVVGGELLKVLGKETERRRAVLAQAATERKIYEQLKENQEREFLEVIEKAERKESDELAIDNFRLRRGSR
ncbi:MAG: flagellar export protein FliJ [Candidatus Zixiibacteriota bacterium]